MLHNQTGDADTTVRSPISNRLGQFRQRQNWAVIVTILVICVITALINPVFLKPTNLINIVRQISILGIVASGMTILMIAGGIDLSVGAALSLAGVICGSILASGYGQVTAVVAGIAVGALIGLVNGAIVVTTQVQPFISTLGMMSILQGLALFVTGGRQIPNLDGDFFAAIGGGMIGFIPVPVVILLAVVMISHFLLQHTKWGRRWYALGGNEETAFLSGVNVSRYKISVYIITGVCVGIAAVTLASRIGAALPLMGSGYELQSIAAVVIGGVSLSGGRGNILGTFLGVLLLGVISNSLNMLNVSAFFQTMAVGLIILLAVIANQYSQRRT
ncbi:MAG: ABC transporter permease [Caldilineales bacterium]|nr:ABC transporter permease [Caldilineales bacterium]